MKAFTVVLLVASALMGSGLEAVAASAAPPDVAAYLRQVVGFPPDRLAALEAGEAIVKIASDEKGEVSVVGAVRIRTTKEHVKLYFDEYIKFEDGVVVLRVGRFGNPPSLADVARLELEKRDVDALASCEPRDCDVKIGAAFADLRAAVDWRGPDRALRVNAFVRQRLVDYVKAYRERGDAALVTYVDGANPVSLAAEWRGLLAESRYLRDYAPPLRRYLEEYPKATLPGSSDLIQWSKIDQGLKPVVVLTHVVLYQDPAKPDRLSVALKQIYASHFYEGAFSLATVVDAPPEAGHSVSYVVFVNRTRTDILRGAFGGVKRKLTAGEIEKAVALTLTQMQQGLEKAAGVQ